MKAAETEKTERTGFTDRKSEEDFRQAETAGTQETARPEEISRPDEGIKIADQPGTSYRFEKKAPDTVKEPSSDRKESVLRRLSEKQERIKQSGKRETPQRTMSKAVNKGKGDQAR